MSNYRYKIENYHSIEQADIAINGITVLAGVNGAGKSTLARWLYYIVNVAYKYETNCFEEYQQSLANIVGQFATARKEFDETNDSDDLLNKAKRSILVIKYNGIESADEVLNIYNAATKQFFTDLKNSLPSMSKNALTRILNYLQLERSANVSDDKWIEQLLKEEIGKGLSKKDTFRRRGDFPWIAHTAPPPPNQKILAIRNVCRGKMLPLHHGKETFLIRLRDISPFYAAPGHA